MQLFTYSLSNISLWLLLVLLSSASDQQSKLTKMTIAVSANHNHKFNTFSVDTLQQKSHTPSFCQLQQISDHKINKMTSRELVSIQPIKSLQKALMAQFYNTWSH